MPPQSTTNATVSMRPWEASMIEVFVRAAALVGLPRSVGEIYGLLYCSPDPLTFDSLVGRLSISKGSVSQGLKVLRHLGAVRLQYVAGSRKDHYVPELSMKTLVRGFVNDQFSPHLESGTQRLDLIVDLISRESDEAIREHALKRLSTLKIWQERTKKLIPVVMAVLGGVSLLNVERSLEKETII